MLYNPALFDELARRIVGESGGETDTPNALCFVTKAPTVVSDTRLLGQGACGLRRLQ